MSTEGATQTAPNLSATKICIQERLQTTHKNHIQRPIHIRDDRPFFKSDRRDLNKNTK